MFALEHPDDFEFALVEGELVIRPLPGGAAEAVDRGNAGDGESDHPAGHRDADARTGHKADCDCG